uniref:Uncharacterized protein n=1 Tax=Arundo donax TaxID=35708 RepID=A0A0A9BXL0_ARUDO
MDSATAVHAQSRSIAAPAPRSRTALPPSAHSASTATPPVAYLTARARSAAVPASCSWLAAQACFSTTRSV